MSRTGDRAKSWLSQASVQYSVAVCQLDVPFVNMTRMVRASGECNYDSRCLRKVFMSSCPACRWAP